MSVCPAAGDVNFDVLVKAPSARVAQCSCSFPIFRP